MSRTLTAAVDSGLAQGNVGESLLAYLDFSSGIVRATNAPYNLTSPDGNVWTGTGTLGAVEAVAESADQQAHELKLKLSGIPADMVSTALGEYYQGRDGMLYWALHDANHQIVADPVLLFSGRIDTMKVEMGATAVITLTVQSRLADWNRARVRRYNDADQQAEYPGDLGFQFVEQMVSVELVWGQAGTSPSPIVTAAAPADDYIR